MACAFVHVVDEDDENKDVRASDLTPELKEAIGDYKLYEHGCCGGQRTAMWRHLYGLDNDAAHDYELKYCAERAYSCSEDTSKLTRARVNATTERTAIIVDDAHLRSSSPNCAAMPSHMNVSRRVMPNSSLRRARMRKMRSSSPTLERPIETSSESPPPTEEGERPGSPVPQKTRFPV